jgi:hypothetical protein
VSSTLHFLSQRGYRKFGNFPPSKYPFGNYFPPTAAPVDFVNYSGGDYHLQSNRPYKNAGTDGKDLGADVDALRLAIAGIK